MPERNRAKILSACGRNIDLIAGGGDRGWNHNWGEAEVYQHVIPAIGTGSRVLDLASGPGRASMPLAMNGAKITLVDSNQSMLDYGADLFRQAGLAGKLERRVCADALSLSGSYFGKYDVVMASNALTHMRKQKALGFVGGLSRFLARNGGMVVVDGPSKSSETYEFLSHYERQIEKDTFEQWCDCSGEERLEPLPFFGPGEIEGVLVRRGARIIFVRDIPATQGDNFNRMVICSFGG